MASQRNTGAFVAGSVLGGLIGAAVALWTTPKSGTELRAGLSGGGGETVTYRAEGGTVTAERRFSNPVLSFVEKAAAPIVGVELGKLAKDDPNAVASAPVRASAADAKPPSTLTTAPQATGVGNATPAAPYTSPATAQGDDTVVNPGETATHDSNAGSTAHAATTEELTHPTGEYVEELKEKRTDSAPRDVNARFPEPPSRT
jgi:hypothetical protein